MYILAWPISTPSLHVLLRATELATITLTLKLLNTLLELVAKFPEFASSIVENYITIATEATHTNVCSSCNSLPSNNHLFRPYGQDLCENMVNNLLIFSTRKVIQQVQKIESIRARRRHKRERSQEPQYLHRRARKYWMSYKFSSISIHWENWSWKNLIERIQNNLLALWNWLCFPWRLPISIVDEEGAPTSILCITIK